MAEENTDANQDGTQDAAMTESSTDHELQPIISDDGLVSTVEYETVEKEDTQKEETPRDDALQNTSEDQKSEGKDFHEHPRFKELVEEKNALKAKVDELSNPKEPESGPEAPKINFKNIMNMNDDDILEDFNENPKGFLSNVALQIAHEIKMDLNTAEQARREENVKLSTQQRIEKTQQEFFADKTDGQEMLNDGRIKAFINENPGHNEISAYHALAGESVVKTKVAEAVKQAEERIYKELKAAGKSKSTATPNGGVLDTSKSPEMKDPNKFGGRDSVLLKRLLARQA